MEIKHLQPGDTFILANERWHILAINPLNSHVLVESIESIFSGCFNNSGNNIWSTSPLTAQLEDYLNTVLLQREPSLDHFILPMIRDLTALDGRVDYGSCVNMITLLTAQEYMHCKKDIKNTSFARLLITPCTTAEGGSDVDVTYVTTEGDIACADVDSRFMIHPVLCLHPDTPIVECRLDEDAESFDSECILRCLNEISTHVGKESVVMEKEKNAQRVNPQTHIAAIDKDICMQRTGDSLWELERYANLRGSIQ